MEEDVLTPPAHGTRIYLAPGAVAPNSVARLLEHGFVTTHEAPPSAAWHLTLDGNRLALRNGPEGACFRPPARGLRRGRGTSAIARACGARAGLTVLDAMAGWGADGLALAAAGCAVKMTESHPLVYALLVDAVARSGLPADVEFVDARRRVGAGFDVVYLDPMFEPSRKTALPKKPMQVLRDVVGRDAPDVPEILLLARRHARERVVVKRQLHGRPIGDPDWRITGRTVRFDVYRPSR